MRYFNVIPYKLSALKQKNNSVTLILKVKFNALHPENIATDIY